MFFVAEAKHDVGELQLPSATTAPYLDCLQIARGSLSGFAILLLLVLDLLAFVQAAQARLLHRTYVDEHVLAALVGLNETVAFLAVEPLHCSCRHIILRKYCREASIHLLRVEGQFNSGLCGAKSEFEENGSVFEGCQGRDVRPEDADKMREAYSIALPELDLAEGPVESRRKLAEIFVQRRDG
jgi:hypothetical protein